jgi:hypothetical protein
MVSDCLTRVSADQGASDFCTVGFKSRTKDTCFQAFKGGSGTRAPGEPCEDSTDCAPSAEGSVRCITSYSSDKGTRKFCELVVPVLEGQTCDGTLLDGYTDGHSDTGLVRACDLEKGVYCPGQGRRCTRIHGVGEACITTTEGSTYYSPHACT